MPSCMLSTPNVLWWHCRHTIAFVMLMSAVELVIGLPWAWYSTFVVEQRHGFNNQSLALFLGALGFRFRV